MPFFKKGPLDVKRYGDDLQNTVAGQEKRLILCQRCFLNLNLLQ